MLTQKYIKTFLFSLLFMIFLATQSNAQAADYPGEFDLGCTVQSWTQNKGTFTGSFRRPNDMRVSIDIEQNESPAYFKLQARIQCYVDTKRQADRITLYSLNNESQFKQNIQKIQHTFKPIKSEGIANTLITYTQGYGPKRMQASNNLFTGESSGDLQTFWITPFGARIMYYVNVTITNLQLLSDEFLRIGGAGSEIYQTGGRLISIFPSTGESEAFNLTLTVNIKPSDMGCSSKAFDVSMTRPFINFGSINKVALEQGKRYQEPFAMNVTKKAGHCTYDITPKVIFNSANLLDNQSVDLYNGLVLRIKDQDGNNIEFGKPLGKSIIPGDDAAFHIQDKFSAEIERSPNNDEIKSGHFSTTLVYQIEYH